MPIISPGIQRSNGQLDEVLFKYFLTGSIDLTMDSPNPSPNWLNNKTWIDIIQASKMPQLDDFKKSVVSKNAQWKGYFDSKSPEKETVDIMKDKSDIGVLNILKIMRPDKVMQGKALQIRKVRVPSYSLQVI